jgi:hypothetical protein
MRLDTLFVAQDAALEQRASAETTFDAHDGSPVKELRRDLRTAEVFVESHGTEIRVYRPEWHRWVTDAQLHRFRSWRFDVQEGSTLRTGFVHGIIRSPLGRPVVLDDVYDAEVRVVGSR